MISPKPPNISNLEHGAADNTSGNAKLTNGFVKRMIKGPGQTMVALVEGAKIAGNTFGGVVQLDGKATKGAWQSAMAIMYFKADRQALSSLLVDDKRWYAFSYNAADDAALHELKDLIGNTASGPHGPGGPGSGLSKVITATALQGSDYFAATKGLVTKHRSMDSEPNINFSNKIVEADKLKVQGSSDVNDDISELGLVSHYLLVGMKAGGTKNTGGVAIVDPNDLSKVISPPSSTDSATVTDIAVSPDTKTALIAATNALWFFYEGTLTKISSQYPAIRLKESDVSKEHPVAFTNTIEEGWGIPGTSIPHSSVYLKDTWYSATGGIFPISMEEKKK